MICYLLELELELCMMMYNTTTYQFVENWRKSIVPYMGVRKKKYRGGGGGAMLSWIRRVKWEDIFLLRLL